MLRREFLLVMVAGACQKKEFKCTDETGLAASDATARHALGYTEPAPDPSRACHGCQQWVPGASNACGKCKVLAGPIHPDGTCRSFSAKS